MANGGKGTQQKNDVLAWALTTAAVTRPTSWQVALFTDATGLTAGGTPPATEATTTTFPGYARQNVTFGTPANGSVSNTNDVKFTATGAGTTAVNYYGIIDNAGTLRYWCPLSTSRTVTQNGDAIDFAIGAITVQES